MTEQYPVYFVAFQHCYVAAENLFFSLKCFICGVALPNDSFSGIWESLLTSLLFGGLC